MILPPDIAKNFLDQYKHILQFAHRTVHSTEDSLSSVQYVEARNLMLTNESILSDYILKESPSADILKLIESIRHGIKGEFILIKSLSKYSVIHHNGKLYAAKGVSNPLENLMAPFEVVKAFILQYGDHLICDGLVERYNIHLGSNLKKKFRNMYRQGRQEKTIVQEF